MIKEIKIHNFRCIKNLKLTFDDKINLIYGENAQGKTSIIEAVYFLATGKSFRTKKTKELIEYTKEKSILYGKNKEDDKIAVEITENKKQFYLNGDKNKYIDHIGLIYILSFIPEDIELITGSPFIRRAFFNYEISQINKKYLISILQYEKILKIRNEYLKKININKNLYEIYEKKYIDLNVEIIEIRKEYINKLNEVINKKYKELFNKNNELKIEYKTVIDLKNKSKDEIKLELTELIRNKKQKEIEFGYSLYGIHKDDYIIQLDNKLAKSFTSQGEKKSIIFALKVSEIEINSNDKLTPIFLMDDINSYFDENRRKKIIEYLNNKNIQCFITSTENQNIEGKEIYIENGEIKNENK